MTIFSLLIQIPGASREVLEPVLMRKSAQLSPQDMLRQHFFRPLLYLISILLVCHGLSW